MKCPWDDCTYEGDKKTFVHESKLKDIKFWCPKCKGTIKFIEYKAVIA